MSIVKMQRLAVLGLDADKKKLISELMNIGVMEITECGHELADERLSEFLRKDSVSGEAEIYEKKISEAAAALAVLEKYAVIKSSLFSVRRRTNAATIRLKAEDAATQSKIRKLLELESELKRAEERINRADSGILMLLPWEKIDLPLGLKGTQTTDIALGIIPKTEVQNIDELTEKTDMGEAFDYCVIRQVSEDRDYIYTAVLSSKRESRELLTRLKSCGFSELDLSGFSLTAAEELKRLRNEKQVAENELKRLRDEVKSHIADKEAIEDYYDYFSVERDKTRITERLLKTESTFLIEGWLPLRTKAAVTEILERNGTCYRFRDPNDDEEVPVLLENRGFFRPTEAITEMYSLPSYYGFDPTSIYALFYIIFFGMMFSDAGYGLLLAIGCTVILKKFDIEGTTEKMMRLFLYCGISTTVWGVLFGGFLGDLIGVFSNTFLGKQIAFNAVWFNPLEDPMKLLIFSLVLGVVHLFIGMGIQAYMQIKEGKWADALFDEGVWYVTIIGLAAWLCGSAAFDSAALSKAGMYMSIAGAAGVLIGGGRGKQGLAKITGALSNIYNITSWISDILSYARLLALGLATGVIAQVVNTMGSLFGGGIAGMVLFVLIFLVGHAVNFAINLLGAFIHSARLQYVEFFGKFYIDGGEPFDPFRRKTKYVRIEDER